MSDFISKEDFAHIKLKPISAIMEKKYLQEHNKYLLKIMTDKIQCYQKYQEDPTKYYNCYRNITEVVQNNYKSLKNKSYVLNKQLSNCLDECSAKNIANLGF